MSNKFFIKYNSVICYNTVGVYKYNNKTLKKEKNLYLIENIGINSLENGLIIKITDNEDNEIWNARTHNNGMCDAILKKMSSNMH